MKRVIWFLLALVLSVFLISTLGYHAPEARAQEPDEPVSNTPGSTLGPWNPSPAVGIGKPAGILPLADTLPVAGTGNPDTGNPDNGLLALSTDQMDPPGTCGVPLGGPFGKDVEMLLNDFYNETEPGWYPRAGLAGEGGFARPSSDVAATALSTEKIAAVWRESVNVNKEGQLYYSIWDAGLSILRFEYLAHDENLQVDWKETCSPCGFDKDNWATIRSGDVDGDGIDELLYRSDTWGIRVYQFNTTSNSWELEAENGPYANNSAPPDFDFDNYPTFHLADIDGAPDGKEELLVRADKGMEAWRFNGSTWDLLADNGPFANGYETCNGCYWDEDNYPTVHSGDVDGDGVDELLARSDTSGIEIYEFNGSGWTKETLIGDLYPNPRPAGFDYDNVPTIQSADIDGDGQAELLMRLDSGMAVYRFNAGAKQWVEVASDGPFSNAVQWGGNSGGYDNYPTIHTGDIDGDGVEELLGRWDEGMEAYRFNVDSAHWEMVASGGPFPNAHGWGGSDGADNYSTIHTGDIDGDGNAEVLGRGDWAMWAYRYSDTPGSWRAEEGWLPAPPSGRGRQAAIMGDPAVLATGGDGWEVYIRDDSGRIRYISRVHSGGFSEWQEVTGVTNAASDPVVISRGPGTTMLFYRDAAGDVWFTERFGGVVWREEPKLLKTFVSRLFLPLLSKIGSKSTTLITEQPETRQATVAADEPVINLSVVSRNENHLSVFIVDRFGRLWVRDWTTLNETDWRDTEWVNLMNGVALEKPAVVSRHSNHMGVAVRNTAGMAYLIDWNAQSGWGSPVSTGYTFSGPLALASTGTQELFLFGPDEHHLVRSLYRQVGQGWQFSNEGPKLGEQDQVISTVVRRPDDVMILARTPMVGLYTHYTSQGQDLIQSGRSLVPPYYEHYRNQALIRVEDRRYYVTLDKDQATSKWKIEAFDLVGDVAQDRLVLTDHPYVAGKPVSIVAADLDFDGSEELVVATYATAISAEISVIDFDVTSDFGTPTLVMETSDNLTEMFPYNASDFALTSGDLDGDGRQNEVVLAVMKDLDSPASEVQGKIYQFVPGEPDELQLKSNGFVQVSSWTSGTNWSWEIEVTTGRLDFTGEKLVLSVNGELNCPSCGWQYANVNTYAIVPSGDYLTFQQEHDNLAVVEGDPLEFAGSPGNVYRTALATGDLDADGYDEIVAWYLNKVMVADTNDLVENEPTVVEQELEPKRPANNAQYFQSPRSLAVDDIDRDGRAEIAAAAWLEDPTGHYYAGPVEYGYRMAFLELMGDGDLQITGYSKPQVGREHGMVLTGDMDGDGLLAELVGCKDVNEYSVVAVLNGLPRWYENGTYVFDSMGSYAADESGSYSEESGTTFNIGASLTVGFEQEINMPIIGTKLGEVRASVTQDFMANFGMSEEREVVTTFGSGYDFNTGLGAVVYNSVGCTCYYYDLYSPENPSQKTRAMACRPGSSDTLIKTLKSWHEDDSSYSWVDVGHQAPDGSPSNDLAIPGNYSPVLPVDEFTLLFEFPPQIIAPQGTGRETWEYWNASQANGMARTKSTHMETNTTISAGATVGSVTTDASATFGFGWDSSSTVGWSESIMFAGGYSWPADQGACYRVVPFVYQATAKTRAGSTYPYWEMDYYVIDYNC